VRSTTRGLAPGQPIRIANAAARRHSRGVVVRTVGSQVEYHSAYDGSFRLAPLAAVHTRRTRKEQHHA
jgi:hypothetical protein